MKRGEQTQTLVSGGTRARGGMGTDPPKDVGTRQGARLISNVGYRIAVPTRIAR